MSMIEDEDGAMILLTTGNILKKSQPDPMTIIDVKDGATFPRKRSFKVTGRHTGPR